MSCTCTGSRQPHINPVLVVKVNSAKYICFVQWCGLAEPLSKDDIKDLFKSIKEVNLNLWEVEDNLRICEKNKDFGKKFIELARKVYLNNEILSFISTCKMVFV